MTTVLAIAMGMGLIALGFELWLAKELREQQQGIAAKVAGLEHRLSQLGIPAGQRPRNRRRGTSPLPANSILNDFELPNIRGGAITLSQWRGQRVAFVFVQPECPLSLALLPRLSDRPPGGPNVVVITTAGAEANETLAQNVPNDLPLLVQNGMELARVWRIGATPSAHFIDENGVTEQQALVGNTPILAALGIGPGITPSLQVESQTTKLDPSRFDPPKPPIAGKIAPPIDLAALFSEQFANQPPPVDQTLIIFFDVACQPCQLLSPELERRLTLNGGGFRLAIIARGPRNMLDELMNEHRLKLPIAMTENWSIARSFGMVETPSAVLLNAEWRVMEPPAIGVSAVLALTDLAISRSQSFAEAAP